MWGNVDKGCSGPIMVVTTQDGCSYVKVNFCSHYVITFLLTTFFPLNSVCSKPSQLYSLFIICMRFFVSLQFLPTYVLRLKQISSMPHTVETYFCFIYSFTRCILIEEFTFFTLRNRKWLVIIFLLHLLFCSSFVLSFSSSFVIWSFLGSSMLWFFHILSSLSRG